MSEGPLSNVPGGALTGAAAAHFTSPAEGAPTAAGRYVTVSSLPAVEFLPGLGFRPVLGDGVLTNFVSFAPGAVAPRHAHEEEQIVIVLTGELEFDLDGDVRTMRPGDVAVIPAWVPHGAWTTDGHCEEVDVFCPPRKSLLSLATAQPGAVPGQDAAGSTEPGARDGS
jgi:quercetin dioxygenase-like cupin family protein